MIDNVVAVVVVVVCSSLTSFSTIFSHSGVNMIA